MRDLGHRNDLSGAILFARRPRLVLPPSPVDKLIVTDALAGTMDPNYTDIGAALKLALASFPEGTAKRMVFISDGNENLGNADEQASLRGQKACRSTRCRWAAGYRNEERSLFQRWMPRRRPTRGTGCRSASWSATTTRPVVTGSLALQAESRGQGTADPAWPARRKETRRRIPSVVAARSQPIHLPGQAEGGSKRSRSCRYIPGRLHAARSRNAANDRQTGLPGDRMQNNRAWPTSSLSAPAACCSSSRTLDD